jgi:leader peptidase (prepilin peptidase)/N-methyltransferase
MLLEALTAVLCSTLAWNVGARPELLAYLWFAVAGVLLAAIDWRTRRLPTRLIWTSGSVLAALFSVAAAVHSNWDPLLRSAAAVLVLLVFYGVLYIVRPGELGGGDLRLGAMSGLALGWAGWSSVVAGTLLGWFAAAASLIALRIHHRDDAPLDLPLGPFIVIGTVTGVLVSPAG